MRYSAKIQAERDDIEAIDFTPFPRRNQMTIHFKDGAKAVYQYRLVQEAV
ncbi:MAG: hypothetical protein KAT70_03785 [Thermoplasmata archaeon]|nr:hypothetical protein [Thermoplasmata archaeon]